MAAPIFHMIDGAPDPVAPFSHAVEADGWVFVTGQMPFIGTANDSPYPDGIEAQTRQALANLAAVLTTAGSSVAKVVKTTIFLADMADFAKVNTLYSEVFAAEPPARSTVQVAALPLGGLVEIEVIALID